MVPPPRAVRRLGPKVVAAVLLFTSLTLAAPRISEARSGGHVTKAKGKAAGRVGSVGSVGRKEKAAPRPKPLPKIVPNQEGRVVVFTFKDDDDDSISSQIQRLLRSKGLEVVTGVRPVDTAEQFREIATTMNLAAFVDGKVKETGGNAAVTVQVRSGYTGKRVALNTFKETKLHIRAEIEDQLWTKIGGPMARACTDATKPRKRGRGPLVIEAGTPLAASDTSSN